MKITHFVTLCLFLLILTGCGHRYSTVKNVSLGRVTFYDTEKTKSCGIIITDAHLVGKNLKVTVNGINCTPEVDAEKYKKISRYGRQPDLLTLPLAPVGLIVGDVQFVEKALIGKHHKNESIAFRDEKLTGRKQQENTPFSRGRLTTTITVRSINEYDERPLVTTFPAQKVKTDRSSTFSIPISSYLEQLEEAPKSLKLEISTSSYSFNCSYNVPLTEQQVKSLNLSNSDWEEKSAERTLQALPQKEQRQIYQKELVAALKAQNYPLAIKNFQRFERLGMDLPDSFLYHYGKTLVAIGDTATAKEKFQGYLDKAGKQGFYAEQSSQYLADLNQ